MPQPIFIGTKISALSAASSFSGTDEFVLNQAGLNKKVDLDTLWRLINGDIFNVKRYGAMCDDAGLSGTDDTLAIQAALDDVPANGGAVYFPGPCKITASLVVKDNTRLFGPSWTATASGPVPSARIRSTAASPIITPSEAISSAITIENLALQGIASAGSKGIYAADTRGWILQNLFLDTFGDQAIHIEGGVNAYLANIFAQGGLLVRSGRTNYIGVIDILIHDAQWYSVHGTTGLTNAAGQIGNGWIAGLVNRGIASFMTLCTGHLSQVGIVLVGSLTRAMGISSNYNQGDGIVVVGNQNDLVGCLSFRDSKDTNDGYAGFKANATAVYNSYTNCRACGDYDSIVYPKYGFEDISDVGPGGENSNRYVNCRAEFYRTAEYSFSGVTEKAWLGYGQTAGEGKTLFSNAEINTVHLSSGGGTPSIAANAGAGTGPTVSISGTDQDGVITVITGTACPAGVNALVTITFSTPFRIAPKGVQLSPGNGTAAVLAAGQMAWADPASLTTALFQLGTGTTPLADSTTYKWSYAVK